MSVSISKTFNELCDTGQELWKDCRDGEYDENKYKKYVEHIKSCAECKKRLEIDEVIDKKDLIPIDD